MMATEQNRTYNGWTNYETWCVNLWMTNDESNYNAALELARECRAEGDDPALRVGVWTPAEHALFTLSDRLAAEFAEVNPLADDANVWADLLGAALSEVNWQEIANHLLDATE